MFKTEEEEYDFERSYWGDCCNTFDEDQKQFVYGQLMGLKLVHYTFMLDNKKILDIGGGPSSLMLKTSGLVSGKVVDPLEYPEWTRHRYACKNIDVVVDYGENVNETGWDEVWIYNCLQHVINPARIISNAKRAAPVLRIFEWIDIPCHEGHPHELSETVLNNWVGKEGKTIALNQSGCYGKAYYGAFEHTPG